MSRLTQSAYQGDTTLHVELGLDWVAGDEIAIAPTANNYLASDRGFIQSYNPINGDLVLQTSINNYHYGDSTSNEP